MEALLCQSCGKNPASIWVTKISEKNISKQCLCKECFRKISDSSLPLTLVLPFSIVDPLIHVGDNPEPSKIAKFKVCKSCNTSWSDFLQTGLLGCSDCYQSFSEYLTPLIEDIHSSLSYKGKVPNRLPKKVKINASLKNLKHQLFKSIDEENYEKAAQIRDKIFKLKEKLKQVAEDVPKKQ